MSLIMVSVILWVIVDRRKRKFQKNEQQMMENAVNDTELEHAMDTENEEDLERASHSEKLRDSGNSSNLKDAGNSCTLKDAGNSFTFKMARNSHNSGISGISVISTGTTWNSNAEPSGDLAVFASNHHNDKASSESFATTRTSTTAL